MIVVDKKAAGMPAMLLLLHALTVTEKVMHTM
jgi:hypothetical protein